MRFLKKLFYTDVKQNDKGTTSESSTIDDDLSDLNFDTAEDLLGESPDVPLAEDDLGLLDEVTQADFSDLDVLPDGGEIDIDEILRSAGIDVDLERDSGQYTMEKVWELLDKGVTEASLPAIIEVASQSVDDVVQNALQKGAACDRFESDFRQRHQELTKSLTVEMNSLEQETDAEIQRLRAEMEAKIQELEDQKVLKLEELKQREQQALAGYNKTIEILDTYEEKCAAVIKALKRAAQEGEVAAGSEDATA